MVGATQTSGSENYYNPAKSTTGEGKEGGHITLCSRVAWTPPISSKCPTVPIYRQEERVLLHLWSLLSLELVACASQSSVG